MASARWAVLALFVVGCRSWDVPAVAAGRRAQFYTQQSDGAYKYGFDTEEGSYQVQEADDINDVWGEFGAEGGHTEYSAGVGGFRVISQTKPAADSTRRYNTAPTEYATIDELTRPVVDTPEVAAAKAKFQADYNRAAAAAAAAPDINIITGAVPVIVEQPERDPAYEDVRYYGPEAPLDADGNVVNTPEVTAARARLQAIQDAAARAAAAAPDRSIISGAVPVIVDPVPVYDDGRRYTGPAATLDADGNVQETTEVKAAKAAFQTAYRSAAAAAAAAPDINIITAPSRAAYRASAARRAHASAATRRAHPVTATQQAHPVTSTRRTHASAATRRAQPATATQRAHPVTSTRRAHATATATRRTHAATSTRRTHAAGATRRTHTDSASRPSYRVPTPAAHITPAVVRLDADGNLVDTPEVAAAKASFKAAYDRAAAAAEAAPDRNIITARPSTRTHPHSAAGHRSSGHRSSGQRTSSGHHGETRKYRVNGVTVEEADGAKSPSKYGYAYE